MRTSQRSSSARIKAGSVARKSAKQSQTGHAPQGRRTLSSKVTARAQTTLPAGVRQALQLEAGDKLEYEIHGAEALIRKAAIHDEEDPAVGNFLAFLARDIERHPERLSGLPPGLRDEIERLTHGVVIDHEEPLDDAVAL